MHPGSVTGLYKYKQEIFPLYQNGSDNELENGMLAQCSVVRCGSVRLEYKHIYLVSLQVKDGLK